MSTNLTKTDPTCSNIELIDANSCYGDSLPIINSNIATLTATIVSLKDTINSWSGVVDYFNSNSAVMLTTMFNLKLINDTYSSPYALLQSLSGKWSNQKFSVYYPNIINVSAWYNDGHVGTVSATNILTPWLTANFPAENFVNNQIINVFVNLSYVNVFTLNFRGNMIEYCTPQYHTGLTLTCDGCNGVDTRYGGCNHDAGGRHWCDNAYGYCNNESTIPTTTYTCKGNIDSTFIWKSFNSIPRNTLHYNPNLSLNSSSNKGHLSIDYSKSASDTFITRIISYTYKNINSTWTIQL